MDGPAHEDQGQAAAAPVDEAAQSAAALPESVPGQGPGGDAADAAAAAIAATATVGDLTEQTMALLSSVDPSALAATTEGLSAAAMMAFLNSANGQTQAMMASQAQALPPNQVWRTNCAICRTKDGHRQCVGQCCKRHCPNPSQCRVPAHNKRVAQSGGAGRGSAARSTSTPAAGIAGLSSDTLSMIMLASLQAALRVNQPLMGDGQGFDGGEAGSEAAAGYDGSDTAEADDKQQVLAGAAGDGLASADGAAYGANDEPAAKRVKVERE